MFTRKWLFFSLSLFLLFFLMSCASNKSVTEEPAKPTTATSSSTPNGIPPNSIFALIKIGMAEQQVFGLIGPGSDMKVIPSGKQWIPFYYGPDTTRRIHYYQNEGRIVFAGGNNRLIGIDYDPTEDGYRN